MITLPILETDKNIYNDLISDKTLSFHYSKHHQTYVTKLNELLTSIGKEYSDIESVLKGLETFPADLKTAIFNNAGQVYNHNLYWQSISGVAEDNLLIEESLLNKINEAFTSLENFLVEFKNAGLTLFGSGWVWLVVDSENNLKIRKTANAETPFVNGEKCLLVMDVWEHAYYLDTQNNRGLYIDNFLKLIDWKAASERFSSN